MARALAPATEIGVKSYKNPIIEIFRNFIIDTVTVGGYGFAMLRNCALDAQRLPGLAQAPSERSDTSGQ